MAILYHGVFFPSKVVVLSDAFGSSEEEKRAQSSSFGFVRIF
jgi:hypothetical protein